MPEINRDMVAHCIRHRTAECRRAGRKMVALVIHPAVLAQLSEQAALGVTMTALTFEGVPVETWRTGREYPHILMADGEREYI